MSYKVQFLKDTSKMIIRGYPKNTLLIYRDGFGYELPKLSGVEYLEFLEYKKKYPILKPEFIIVIGLNRIITPSNRCDMVNEYLQTMSMHTPKICIDTAPFIGEPWRLWFHYSVANCNRFNITYSYAIETEWESWFYRDVPDSRLAGENIKQYLSHTYSDLEPLRAQFTFRKVEKEDLDWYAEVKSTVFEKYGSPKLLINNLLKQANIHYSMKLTFDSYRSGGCTELPDLRVFRFVVEENMRRLKIYNEVIKT